MDLNPELQAHIDRLLSSGASITDISLVKILILQRALAGPTITTDSP